MNNLLEAVTDALDVRNVGPHIIQKIPGLIKRAVIELQTHDVIPPRNIEFVSEDKKEQKRDNKDEVMYNYYRLPEDFRKLDEFFVYDKKEPYEYTPYSNYFWQGDNQKRKFSIIETSLDNDPKMYSVMIVSPFPDDDMLVKISYHVDGTLDTLSYLDEEYFPLIIQKIEELLGIRNPMDVDNTANEMSSRWRNRQGINSVNGTMYKTKGKFFARMK